ncbi:hypothetical protein [Streptomyces fuscigenes]|uniref:hypothetical protein n=1 Tax=Streptomyces fuscigenes TaxID=1528880 RepID=UPI001F1C80B2|nr:hypothetical protein [Streptomyces fuscigenes]MCF3961724.1 hypothetical protein [Streptomyces fuscigenes]
MTHEQMYALLKSADMETVSNLSQKLSAISTMVTKIGNHLKAHVGALGWEGKGGEAFREWGNQTANATFKLADYADSASIWMGHVSQAIVEAHSNMPALSITTNARTTLHTATEHMKDSDSPTFEKSAMLASSHIEGTRSDAAAQMQKLATTYVQAGTQINGLKPPTFPPPASQLGQGWHDTQAHRTVGDGAGGVRNVDGGGGVGGSRTEGSSSAHSRLVADSSFMNSVNATSSGHSHSVPAGEPAAPAAHMEIDGASPPIAPPHISVPSVPEAHHSTAQGLPGVVPPAFGGPPVSGAPYSGAGSGPLGGRQDNVPSSMRLPRGSFSEKFSTGRPTMPRESGIAGGRAVESSNGRPPARLPRGMVVGGEEGTQGTSSRGMMGRGASGLHMGPEGQTAAGRNGLVSGRRLASEPGGVVGRSAQPGKAGARPFTQGGSGLLRDGSGASEDGAERQVGRTGMAPQGRKGARRRNDEHGDARPDYLVEDEETWQQGDRRVVPPVIE